MHVYVKIKVGSILTIEAEQKILKWGKMSWLENQKEIQFIEIFKFSLWLKIEESSVSGAWGYKIKLREQQQI